MLKKKLLFNFAILLFFIFFTLNAYASGKRIAVLPFNVPPEEQSLQQFGMGTMETLTHALGSIKSLTLVNRSQIQNILSEISFQNSGFTASESSVKAGKLSGIDIIVTGTIQVSNGKLRITAHFTEVESGMISETFQVTGTDIFDLQDQLANQILKAQKIEVTSEEKEKISRITKATVNQQAYKLYTEARFKSFNVTFKAITEAIDLYNQALENDPAYTFAIAGKIEAHALLALIAKEQGKEYLTYQKEAEFFLEAAKKDGAEFIEIISADFILNVLKEDKAGIEQTKKEFLKTDVRSYISLINNLAGFYKTHKKPAEALAYYQEAVQLQPDLSYIRNNMALHLKSMGETEKAIKELENIISKDPGYITAYTNLGNIYYLNNEPEKALLTFEKGLKVAPEDAIIISAMANNLRNEGKQEEALQLLLKSLGNKNKSLEYTYIYSDIAYIMFEKEKYEEAEKYFHLAMDLDPDNTSFYGELARTYHKKGNTEKVNSFYSKKKDIISEDYYLLTEFGTLFVETGRQEDGMKLLRQAAVMQPDNNYVLFSLAGAYKLLKQYQAAIEIYEKLKISSPKNDLVYYSLGEIYKEQKLYDKAIIEFKALTARKPKSTKAFIEMGELYSLIGNNSEALAAYEKAYSINNKLTQVIKKISEINIIEGHFYFKENKLASAENSFRKALLYTPDNPDIYNNLGVIYYTRKEYGKAIENYNKALVLDPGNANAYDNMGIVFQAQGKISEALEQYQKACKAGNNSTCKWLRENIKN